MGDDGVDLPSDRFIAAADQCAFDCAPRGAAQCASYSTALSSRLGLSGEGGSGGGVFRHGALTPSAPPPPQRSDAFFSSVVGGSGGGSGGGGGSGLSLLALRDFRSVSPPPWSGGGTSGERTPTVSGRGAAAAAGVSPTSSGARRGSPWSPPDATPGEATTGGGGGDTTPRKQVIGMRSDDVDDDCVFGALWHARGTSPSSQLLPPPLPPPPLPGNMGTPTRTPLMRTPIQRATATAAAAGAVSPLASALQSPFASPQPARRAATPGGAVAVQPLTTATGGTAAGAGATGAAGGALGAGVVVAGGGSPGGSAGFTLVAAGAAIAGAGGSSGGGGGGGAHRRRDGMSPARILDARGISDEYDASVVAWGRRHLVIALGSVVYLWRPEAVGSLFEARSPVSAVACSPPEDDADYVAVGLANGLLHVFRVGEQITSLPPVLAHSNVKITGLALCGSSLFSATREGVLCLVDLVTAEAWRTEVGSPIFRLAATTDGSHIAVGTATGVVVYHRTNLATPTVVSEAPLPVRALAWAPRSDIGLLAFAAGPRNSEVVVYSLGSGVRAAAELGAEVCSLLWTHNGELVAGCGPATHTPRGGTPRLTASPGGTGLATSMENAIGIFEVLPHDVSGGGGSGRLRRAATIHGHSAPALHSALSPDGATLVTGAGGGDATLRFWSAVSAPLRAPPVMPPIAAPLFDDELR